MANNKHIRFDWAIKRLLRQKSNFGILEGFLSELLMEDIKILEIIESETNKEDQYDKSNRVDILVKSINDEIMLIEIQNEREHDYFHRMNYGQSKLTTEYIYEGDKYGKIKKIFSINIVYFELGQGEDYVYIGETNFKGIHKSDILNLSDLQKKAYPNLKKVSDIFTTYYIIKVNNFDDIAKSTLDEWIYFLKNSEIKTEFKAKGLQEANQKMRRDNLEGIEKENYENYVKIQRIKMAELETAQLKGIMVGKVKAEKRLMPIIEKQNKELDKQNKELEKQNKELEQKEKEFIAMVKNMKNKGYSNQTIADITNRNIGVFHECQVQGFFKILELKFTFVNEHFKI